MPKSKYDYAFFNCFIWIIFWLKYLTDMAERSNYGYIEWCGNDWNKLSVDFYTKKLGAEPMKDWTVFRLGQKAIKKL